MFKKLDHIAIAVRDTEKALVLYRDTMGLPLLHSEVLEGPGVRLTHLDMGNLQLQLVEPLNPEHPISKFLDERGDGLHHLCWQVPEIEEAMADLAKHGLKTRPNEPHDAPKGKKAAFIEPSLTHGVLWEMTEG
ncbi:methylmalonyl-CoA epimerase [Verrucomicrobiaceae bacterium 227]